MAREVVGGCVGCDSRSARNITLDLTKNLHPKMDFSEKFSKYIRKLANGATAWYVNMSIDARMKMRSEVARHLGLPQRAGLLFAVFPLYFQHSPFRVQELSRRDAYAGITLGDS